MASFQRVLTAPELLTSILAYQHGIPYEFLPFLPLQRDNIWSSSCSPAMLDALNAADGIFRPWFEQHGLEHLPLLVDNPFMERMRPILLLHAVFFGRFDVLDFMASLDPILLRHNPRLLDLAAATGSLEMIQFLQPQVLTHVKSAASMMVFAADNGHLHIVRFVAETMDGHFDSTYGRVLLAASVRGHYDMASYVLPHCTPSQISEALAVAVRHEHVDFVARLVFRCPDSGVESALHFACDKGQLDMTALLVGELRRRLWFQLLPTLGECLRYAVRRGYVAIATLLWESGVAVHAVDVEDAARDGHLPMLQWLHQVQPHIMGKPSWDQVWTVILTDATHDQVVQWLSEITHS
ncbi:Aste57867_21735 [Aphanomyces stellatus]|uniref:Aste57867_21735 protein n=1 Tax=Aphanomyces stellatus TaxID=120398 RepID=A0A485LIA9_9STRA|nr:hypothetical protein As57867_021666 [Aphanomyces stellatus]VFT98404.1 Aste57867_21735 [Aphanomyces stellatus]